MGHPSLTNPQLYAAAIALSAAVAWLLTPVVRLLAVRYDWLDKPTSSVKTHKQATPCLGGVAIWLAFTLTLVGLRFLTQFPTGTLYSLRALVLGGMMVFLLGFLDDVQKPAGLHFKPKFVVQIAAALLLASFGIRIRFITPDYLAWALTVLWVVGITNAFNIIDIMDGLCASQAIVAALAFLLIALPSEEIYVNFAAAAVLGSALGYLPWNFSPRYKMFMGDSGSLLLGFLLAALSLGTSYSQINPLGVYAPLLILMVPMYDTIFVMIIRLLKGQSPFLGSKDHFALRLEAMGFSRHQIVAMAAVVGCVLSGCALLVTLVRTPWAILIYAMVSAYIVVLSRELYKIEMR